MTYYDAKRILKVLYSTGAGPYVDKDVYSKLVKVIIDQLNRPE